MQDEDAQPKQQPAEVEPDFLLEESRSLPQTLGTLFLEGTATGAGLTAGALGVKAGAEKIKETFAPKDDGPKIELPPGSERE